MIDRTRDILAIPFVVIASLFMLGAHWVAGKKGKEILDEWWG